MSLPSTLARQRRVLAALGALVLGGVMIWLWQTVAPGITLRNIRAIRPGMTRAQVESLLGAPPGLYDAHVTLAPVPPGAGAGKHWVGSQAGAYVVFDDQQRVERVYELDVQPMPRAGWWGWR